MPKNILTVGLSEIKPLVFKHGKKEVGFEIELWEKIAERLKLKYRYKRFGFLELLTKVAQGEVDVAMAGITQTRSREKLFDFTHFTMNSSLMIMISSKSSFSFFKSIKHFIGEKYKKILVALILLLVLVFGVSNLIWFIERSFGTFNGDYLPGIFESLWWTITTVATVGYGDFVPHSIVGRVIAMFIMCFGIMFFGMYTAEVASVLTSSQKKYKISTHHDLQGKKVATKKGTVAAITLVELGAIVVEVSKIEQAYYLLKQRKVDAVVFDAPVLMNECKDNPDDFILLDDLFSVQSYGFALAPSRGELKEKINVELLGMRESGEYQKIYQKGFGDKII